MIVERTDFVSVPVTDLERSTAFYRDTLGLRAGRSTAAWPEFQLGENVSLYLLDPTNIGQQFTAAHLVDRAARPRRRGGAGGARGEGCRVRRRDVRHGRLPHGVLPRSGRQRPHAPPPVRAPCELSCSSATARCRSRRSPTSTGASPTCPGSTPTRSLRTRATEIAAPDDVARHRGGRGRGRQRGRDRDRARARGRPVRAAHRRPPAAALARRLGREVRRPQRGDVAARPARATCRRASSSSSRSTCASPTRSREARSSGGCWSWPSRRAASR